MLYGGQPMARQNKLVTAAELAFMQENPASEAFLRTDVGSDGNGFTNPQNWVDHLPDGFNASAGRALNGEEGVVTRTFMPRYRLMYYVLRHLCGEPVTTTLGDLRTKHVFTFPDFGAPTVETVTGYYGIRDGLLQLIGGKLRSFNIDVTRNADGGSLAGNIEYHFNWFRIVTDFPNTTAANAQFTLTATDAVASLVLSLKVGDNAAANVTITLGMSTATVKSTIEAHADITTVTVTGTPTGGSGPTDGQYIVTVTAPGNTPVVATIVSPTNDTWTLTTQARGGNGLGATMLTGPYLEALHCRVYIADDDADLLTIDVFDIPDHDGTGGDPHMLTSSPGSTWSVADMWNPFYGQTGVRHAIDMVGGAMTVAGSVTVPNSHDDASDCQFLLTTQDECLAAGFWRKRAFVCGPRDVDGLVVEETAFEYHEDCYMSRTDAADFSADNDLYMRTFPLGRMINPEGTGSLRFTLILPPTS